LAATVYEGMLILDSTRYSRDPEGIANQIHSIIQQAGGEILVSRLWEERRLAYPIKSQRKGTYWLVYIRLEGPKIDEIRHQCHINESILRELFLKVDPRIVETLVAHARTGQFATSPRPEVASEGASVELPGGEVEAVAGEDVQE
jgi:small subunit ribosomal protein S6